MRAWSVPVTADRFAAARLYQDDVIELAGIRGPREGDAVALVTTLDEPVIFALAEVARVRSRAAEDPGADDPGADQVEETLVLSYTHRFFESPRPAADLVPNGGARPIDPAALAALRAVSAQAPRTWLVRLDLPIEAASPAEAVRQFWTYVRALGPAELPTFVSPTDDELSMQAFVLGEEANQDPEED